MKKNYIILLFAILCSGITIAQETQKNFINYQGVARDGADQLMANETMTIGIALKMGSASGASAYAENHSVTTDANGVFSLKIGSGDAVSGDFNTIAWGAEATFVTVMVNGSEIGTTEMMAVPYALSSGDGSQSANEVPYDNSVSGLTATNAQEAIDELVGSGGVDADADPTNEFQLLSFDAGTNALSLSDGNTITIPSGSTDADADPTNEIQTISFDAVTNEINLTDGGTITIPSGGTDADADPANELQTLAFDPGTNELSLSDGNSVTIPSGGTDADADPTNELQDISLSGTELAITEGSTIDLASIVPPGGTDDQNLILSGDVLSIENGSGSVDLSTYAGDDADADPTNEIDVTTKTGILLGNGAVVDGLVGTADGQVAKWNADTSTWEAGTDATSIGGGSSLWSANGSDIYYEDGNVGIGTDSPSSPLTIVTHLAYPITLEADSDGATLIQFANNSGPIGVVGKGAGSDMRIGTNSSNLTGVVWLSTREVPRLVVAANGDVGIGTLLPRERLEVADGTLLINTEFGPASLQIGEPGNASRWKIGKTPTDNLEFGSKPVGGAFTTHFRMLKDGEFQLGDIGSPSAWAHIRNNSSTPKPQLKLEEIGDDFARLELTNSAVRFWHLAGYVGNTLAQDRFNIYNSEEGNIISVHGNGDVVINGSVAHSSDRRLKRDVVALPYGLETIMQLSPKAYYWKKDEENEQRSLGLIAQDVQPIIKEVVHGGGEDDDMLSISYTELVPVLIKAIQEQQEVIQQLRIEQKGILNQIGALSKNNGTN